MNKVEVYKWEHTIEDGKSFNWKVYECDAVFCSWGVDYEELENGIGNYSTAIVQLSDGSIKNVECSLIRFL